MMSGTDLSMFGYVKPFWRPRDYAADLGAKVGCPNDDMYTMVQCLRDNATVPWQKIVAAQHRVMAHVSYHGDQALLRAKPNVLAVNYKSSHLCVCAHRMASWAWSGPQFKMAASSKTCRSSMRRRPPSVLSTCSNASPPSSASTHKMALSEPVSWRLFT